MATNWTKPQNDAICARGGSVLVSAAAGSGKTAVLVERAISLICDKENPADADKLLMVTFSNAAAAEMKQRIGRRLSQMLSRNPGDLFLQRQQTLLLGAQICTIHSFCLDLLRANFQDLKISPDFSVADENELYVMQRDCAEASIEEFYQNDGDGEFAGLVELLFSGRDDKSLADIILKIYNFGRSHPFFEDWLDEKLEMYDTALPASETVWGKSLLRYAVDSLDYCVNITGRAIMLAQGDEKLEKAYGGALKSDLHQLEACLCAARLGEYDKCVEALSAFEFARLGSLRGDDPAKERIKDVRQQVKDVVAALSGKYLNATEADFKDDMEDLRSKIKMLFALVKDFAERFASEKAEKQRLDFSDFEHFALELLVKKTDEGYQKTAKAKEISERFAYVLVDEYQDTNEVQDLIFTSISREQQNLFMVGDVKQSIYSFRQAMPEIFLAKKEKFFPYDTGFYPAKINLDTNFRSRRQVTDAVNYLFSGLMSKELGSIDYDLDESLKCGAVYPENDNANPEFMLLDAEGFDGDATGLEAAAVAKRIHDMIESGYLVDSKDGMRPAEPGDFCVLLRAPKNRADIYVRKLTEIGVPAWAESAGGYLKAREVSAVLCMLKSVDNPLLDVELVAAMMSPFFDFTDDEIALIRMSIRGVPFYTALIEVAQTDDKAAGFLKIFTELRTQSAILSADKLIMKFYEMTGAVAVVRAMSMGESRAANLWLLVEYAAEYHKMGYKQLGGFIGFINRIERQNRDLAPASTVGDGLNVVRVMSIHRSKGLEFPVVFLSDTSKQFNKMDLRASTILHSKYGFACIRRDIETHKQFTTLPMQAIRLENERSMLSEEMRVLYVALTRAREKLIITAVCKSNLQKKLGQLACELKGGKLSGYDAGRARSYADWIIMLLLRHKSADKLRAAGGAGELETSGDNCDWDISICDVATEEQETQEKSEVSSEIDYNLLALIKNKISYEYPCGDAVITPAKLAVSSIATAERSLKYRFSARPKFMTSYELTAAEKGNATHKFMQFSNYENARLNLDDEIARMGKHKFLSPIEVENLNKKGLRAFFKSELARRIFDCEKIYRELKFMAECDENMLSGLAGQIGNNEKIVLQGVADCVFVENGKAVIVDYKTDFVNEPGELVKRYKTQLELYKIILGKSLEQPVEECIIYSFALGEQIKI